MVIFCNVLPLCQILNTSTSCKINCEKYYDMFGTIESNEFILISIIYIFNFLVLRLIFDIFLISIRNFSNSINIFLPIFNIYIYYYIIKVRFRREIMPTLPSGSHL